MEKSGMIRKLDEVGRIVIPKEIRNHLRLQEGAPLEIVINDIGDVVLKKYSEVKNLKEFAIDFCDIIYEMLSKSVLITDREEIVYCVGAKHKEYLGKKLNSAVHTILQKNESYIANKGDGTTLLPIVENDSAEYYCQLIYPIIRDDNFVGSIILFCKEETNFDSFDIKVVECVAKYLSRKL